MHLDPQLTLTGYPIPVVESTKFLGVIFDKKLNFLAHIKYLKLKCQKALNLLRVVSSMDWGADRRVLLRLYRCLICSKLDYGCIVYGSALKSYIRQLDPVQNQGLKICLGAFRTSPVESLQVEANEPSLYLRREKLALQYTLKLKSNPSNPTYKCAFHPQSQDLFLAKPSVMPPFGIRYRQAIEELHIDLGKLPNLNFRELHHGLMSLSLLTGA